MPTNRSDCQLFWERARWNELSRLQSNPGKYAPSWKRWDAILKEHLWERYGMGEILPSPIFLNTKTPREGKPGLSLAPNQIVRECQEKQQLIRSAKCSSHVFTPDVALGCLLLADTCHYNLSGSHVTMFKSSSSEFKFLSEISLS